MATKQVSVRMAAVGGKQVKAELVEIGAAGERSFNQLDRSARVGGGGLQNLGFQVQDFAVQVGAGTSATQALAQQLPQLLSGFGLLGVAIGTATAIAIPLSAAFLGAKEQAESLDTVLRNMDASVKALEETAQAFSAGGLTELAAKYGEVNAAVLLLIQRQRELAVDEALGQAQAAIASMNAEIGSLFRNRVGELADFLGVEESVRQVDSFGNAIRAVNPIITEFQAGLIAVSEAATFEEQAAAVADLLDLMDETSAKGGELYRSFVQAESALRAMNAAGGGVNGWLDAAIGGAGDLAGQLWEAARAAFSVGQNQAAAAAAQPAVGDDRLAQAYATYGATRSAADDPMWAAPAAPVRRGGGGARRSGGGGGRGGMSDDAREAARIFEETRTEAEKYATQLERLNELHAGGFVSADTFGRAIEQLGEKTKSAKTKADDLNASFAELFETIVLRSEDAGDALSKLLNGFASELARGAFSGLNTAIFGKGGIGAVVAGLFGGGRAGGGPVMGGRSYMVGEAGPEMITMGGNGYVTSTSALRSAVAGGGGGVVFNVDARGATEGVAAQIQRAIAEAAPAIVRASVQANRGAAARGM